MSSPEIVGYAVYVADLQKLIDAPPKAEYEKFTMVIAHVLTSLHIGGGERVTLDRASMQVRRAYRVLGEGGVSVLQVVKRSGLDPALPLRLALCFRSNRVDVVHMPNRLPLIYGVPAARGSDRPFRPRKRFPSTPSGDANALRTRLISLREQPAQAASAAALGSQLVRARHSRQSMSEQYAKLYANLGAST